MSGVYTRKPLDEIDTSEGALPFNLQRVAEDELGETPARRKESLEKLLQSLSKEEGLHPRQDAAFLLRFLRVRKYNVEAALRTIRNYYRNRNTSRTIFEDLTPSSISEATRRIMMIMPGKDVCGRPIFLFKIGSWDIVESSYVEMHRAAMLCLEHLAKDPTTQTLGMVMLFDYAKLTPEKVLSINVGLIRRGFEYLQDCMPMRMKAMYAVREGFAFDMVYALVRPFLKKKLADRFHPYGENFEELHKHIDPHVLPKEYGGDAPPLDFNEFWSKLEVNYDDYKEDRKYGYITNNQSFATDAEIEKEVTFL
ncbi:alpha-tocopherol transfer protein-like isoform X2 [Dermacentor andersoni]|uniref:alpha-tocopherol transfer protein-like isoform X2 n=1 Tax=Dermacentor andersoni TaxID=34620 RepID=UPI0021556800|nr:alpha-tocopherol transfer protein-like isoform X1 [Dermacentor andersoni]